MELKAFRLRSRDLVAAVVPSQLDIVLGAPEFRMDLWFRCFKVLISTYIWSSSLTKEALDWIGMSLKGSESESLIASGCTFSRYLEAFGGRLILNLDEPAFD